MLTLAFWLLLAAALGGATIATLDIATAPIRLGHGALAGFGLLILLVGALAHGGALIWTAFGMILISFAAGAVFFGMVWRNSAPPRALIIGHGVLNALGVILLGLSIFA